MNVKLCSAALAFAFAAFATNAPAQDVAPPPSVVERHIDNQFEATRAETVTMSSGVSYRGVDLRQPENVERLRREISIAARAVCRQQGLRAPPSYSPVIDPLDCYYYARRDALRKLNRAVTRANSP